jgi:hypothetical protein
MGGVGIAGTITGGTTTDGKEIKTVGVGVIIGGLMI